MHNFDAATPVEETMRALDDLVAAGKVRYLGCSNFSGWQVMKAQGIAERRGWSRYVAHQAQYSLAARDYEWELMPAGLDQGLGALVWSPLAGGLLTGKIRPGRPAPAGSRIAATGDLGLSFPSEQFQRLVEVLDGIAQETQRSVSQVALRWVLQRPSVSSAIIGARNETQLKENLAATEFTLDAGQMQRLDAASARPLPYPYGHQRRTMLARNPPPV